MALTVSARARWNGPSAPALIRAAALCAALGIGLSLTEYVDTAKWLAVIGVLLLIVALHRFGRMGPDEPIHFQLEPARKKKKKKQPAAEADPPAAEASPGEAPSEEGGPSQDNE
jgi:hypothetical protein